MNKIKNILLALCIGVVFAIIYDNIFPEYNYYDEYNKEISKEVYLMRTKEASYSSNKYYKLKKINRYTLLLGTVVTVAMFIVDPLKRKL